MMASSVLDTTSSLVLMRNLLRLSLSNIAFERHFFDSDCFTRRQTVHGQDINIITGITEESKLLIQWLEEGVFHALNHSFLQLVTLAIESPTEDCVSPRRKNS